jgi:hypothetical protein
MSLDDDSLLSAYMDGRLGPDQQQWVESALVSDPQAAEALRHLTILRDLVAGLSREAPVDVSPAVMARIDRRLRLRTFLRGWLRPVRALPRRVRLAGALALPAMLLTAVVMTPSLRWHPPDPPIGAGRDSRPVDATTGTPSRPTSPTRDPDAPEHYQPSFVSDDSGDGASDGLDFGDDRPAMTRTAAAGVLGSGGIEHVRQYLDHPHLRHVLLVADLDGTAQRQVASVVERTTRLNFYRITVSQGIVIDPRHPDEATVFALVVSPRELKTLCQKLREVLNERVEEVPVEPGIVTQLAQIDDVQAFIPAGALEIPRDDLAIKQPGAGSPRSAAGPDRREPTPEQFRSAPVPVDASRSAAGRRGRSDAGPARGTGGPAPARPSTAGRAGPPGLAPGAGPGGEPRGSPRPAEEPDRDLVVLVWVSRPRSG